MAEPGDAQAPPPSGPVAAQHVYVQTKTNGFAIAALVLGIVWVYWIGSILALVFGYIAKSQLEQAGGRETGMGMAVAGIVLGWIGVGILLLFVLLFAVGSSSMTLV